MGAKNIARKARREAVIPFIFSLQGCGANIGLKTSKSYTTSMLKATEKIWCNGQFIPWNDAKIHVLSHVVSYGSSVFEGIRCYETTNGPAVFRLSEHMRRMV